MFRPQPSPFSATAASSSSSSSAFSSPLYGDIPGYSFQSTPLTTGGPIILDQPIFTSTAPHFLPLATGSTRFPKMEMGLNAELDAQEAAARSYQPDLKGDLVGERKSTTALREEYAKADPVYIAKTAALPNTYAQYRQVLGDGNCGWRAIGFSYYELLAQRGDKAAIDGEIARMMSLTNLITNTSGYDEWTFEAMRDEVIDLLKDIAASLSLGFAHSSAVLLERFNDAERSNSIVYYFRLVASSWLRANANMYSGFIQDGQGIDGYCKNSIDSVNTEIDHLGMTLLIDALMKPVGISVEIVYLDRSEGSQVNSHLFEAEENPFGINLVAHLLYRPGHYDILYKKSAPISPPANVQINRAFTQAHQAVPIAEHLTHNVRGDCDYTAVLSLPGMSYNPNSTQGYVQPFAPLDAFYGSAPKASVSPVSPISSVSPVSSLPAFSSTSLPIHTLPHASASPPQLQSPSVVPAAPSVPTANQGQSHFRPSKYEYEAEWAQSPEPTFQTSTFKNSHYNTAHYNNPNFQPEEWSPDSEEATGRRGK